MKLFAQTKSVETRREENQNNFQYKLLSLLFIVIALLFFCELQANNPDKEKKTEQKDFLTKEEMLTDFRLLKNAIEEAHGGIYRFVEKNELNKIFAEYEKKINKQKSRLEFIAFLSQMISEVRDGHMRLEYDDKTRSELNSALRFPYEIGINENKIIVIYNDSPDDSLIKPGTEIISINGYPTDSILQKILCNISGDGFIETGKISLLERRFDSYFWLFVDQSPIFKIVAKDANGKLLRAEVKGIKRTQRKNYRKNNPLNAEVLKYSPLPGRQTEIFTLKFYENNKIAHLSIRAFQGEDFISKLDLIIENVINKKAKVFILDLRGNGGGVDEYGANLVSRFTDKPFRYFDKIHLRSINPSFTTWKPHTYKNLNDGTFSDGGSGFFVSGSLHTGVLEQQPSGTSFLGKLIVLTDGRTFSTAADVCASLYSQKRATFIGEETGGAYSGNTSGLNAKIDLPNSQNSVKIHMYEYWNAVTEPAQKGRGTIPDFPVENIIKNLIKGTDSQLDFALKHSRKYLNE